ncbi:sigma-70 family RNA polymerase sigma factor [Streptomyces sp. NPDC051907]|uniref:sigma-70 family RNA polymerase sigma factor n=1 Tax=Streptomyces sp. NPDC051907 TaxID=3155284 RepID=UPI0034408DD4
MASEDSEQRHPKTAWAPGTPEVLTEDQAERMLAHMNEVIRAGDEMRKLRTEMVKALAALGWTQDRIAQLTEMTQPAVSKQVAKYKKGDSPPPVELSLDQHDGPWLEGRLWGLAEEIAETLSGAARCAPYLAAVARGKKRFTPQNVDELRRLVEDDLRTHQAQLPGGCRDAYDTISRGLDLPAKATPRTADAAVGSASARRALACRLQRVHLR